MTLIPAFIHSFRRMITYQTWPPRMSFEFRPQDSTMFNFHRGRFPVRIFQRSWIFRRFGWCRFLSIDWRKPLCSFLRWMVLLFVCCFTANWRRRLLWFWCKIREKSRHVYVFPSTTHVNNFPAFLPRYCACTIYELTGSQTFTRPVNFGGGEMGKLPYKNNRSFRRKYMFGWRFGT